MVANNVRAPLRVATAQFDAVSGDTSHNLAQHCDLLHDAHRQGAALVVFPELSVTGYCASLLDRKGAACAIDPDDALLAPLRALCAEYSTAAVIGMPLSGPAGLHLSAVVIGQAGQIAAVYHKMYLDEDERKWFTRGSNPCTFVIRDWKLGLGICYDSSFPEHGRGYALDGADAYLVSGAFPLGRSDFRRTIYFPARALENTMYLVFSNYTGDHDGQQYGGRSAVYGPDGQCLKDAGGQVKGLAVYDLDDTHLMATRQNLQMLQDL